MRISDIIINNFRIYRGENHIDFENKTDKNIHLIAGKNGFGKTTFLTSLIWVLYGKQMSQVEDKYKIDIRHVGGYDKYLESLLNRDLKREFDIRSCVGIDKYKTTLQDNNKDDFLQHLKEELMDAALYIQKLQSNDSKR